MDSDIDYMNPHINRMDPHINRVDPHVSKNRISWTAWLSNNGLHTAYANAVHTAAFKNTDNNNNPNNNDHTKSILFNILLNSKFLKL
jgi:hypothetical protein